MFIGQNDNTSSYPSQYASVFAEEHTRTYLCGMSKLRERLQEELDKRGWNAYDLERASGVPQPTTQRFLKGTHGDPRGETVAKWAKGLGVTEQELRGLAVPSVFSGGLTFERIPLPSPRKVPFRGTVIVGSGGKWTNDALCKKSDGEGFVMLMFAGPDAYAICVQGELPKSIKSGWFLVVEPTAPQENGDYVIVETDDGVCQIKEFLFEKDGLVTLEGIGGGYERMALPRERIVKMESVSQIVVRKPEILKG